MLSSVLRSERAVQVNIAIMRAFVQLRQVLGSHAELARKLRELEQRIEGHDTAIRSLFDAIRQLMEPSNPEQPTKEIGFHVKEQSVRYRIKRTRRESIRRGDSQPHATLLPSIKLWLYVERNQPHADSRNVARDSVRQSKWQSEIYPDCIIRPEL